MDSTSFSQSLIHFTPSLMITLYWIVTAVVFVNGLFSLWYLRRFDEKHHLYWGAIGLMLILVFHKEWWIARALCTLMIVDDSINHFVQVMDVQNGRQPRPDWTPGHKIGVWIMLALGWDK